MLFALLVGCGTVVEGEESGTQSDCEPLFAPGYCPSGLVCDTCDGTIECNQDVAVDDGVALGVACAGPCPAYGTWGLDLVRCGDFVFDTWIDTWGQATLTMYADGGACFVDVGTTTGCRYGERWRIDADGRATLVDEICTAVCELPDGTVCDGDAGRGDGSVRLDAYGIEALGLLLRTTPTCTLPFRTNWSD